MKKMVLILALSTFFASCQRSSSQVWEDTKTCGRYVNRGVKSLIGRNQDGQLAYIKQPDDSFLYLTNNPSSDLCFEEVESNSYATKEIAPQNFVTPTNELAAIFMNIHFDTDNYVVKGEENFSTIRKIVHYLTSHPNCIVTIEGHTDERGAAAYNLALGARRANAIKNYLIEKGVNPDQLQSISYGKEIPCVDGHNETAWRENRRGQFKIHHSAS